MTIQSVRGTATPIFNTTPTGPASTTPAATPTGATPTPTGTIPAGGGNAVNARPIATFGLQGTSNSASGTMSRFARDAAFDSYSGGAGDTPVGRGFVKIDAVPIKDGCRIEVASFHGSHNDRVTLYLLAEVFDSKTNQFRTITLSVLARSEVLNSGTYRGKNYYDLNYNDVNAWLQQRNPALKLVPGHTNLAVSARWDIGHQAGGFARGGAFRIPPPLNATSVTAARSTSAAASEQTDLPLDMQVAFPQTLQAQVPTLKPGGSIQSRLESELKGNTSRKEMVNAVHEMYRLAALAHAGNDREIEKMLGKDWTVETVNRYWVKDDGSAQQPGSAGTGFFQGFRVDKDGLPLQDQMRDSYMDDGNLMMTRHEGAIRLRKNAQATVVNVKPGGGRRDPQTQITQRIEVGVEMQSSANTADAARALQQLQSGAWAGTIFNHAQKEVSKLDPNLNLSNCLVPWLDVTQDRHKFTVKNKKTGVEIELSLDFVSAKTLRPGHAGADGQAREVTFCTLEAELDHLQLQSANQSTYVAGGAVQSQAFLTDNDQDTWLKSTSADVTMDIDPRLHELKDLDNKSFRSTGSYTAFEGVTAKLVPALFPKGLGEGRQKAAHAAALLGLVSFDDAALRTNIKGAVESAGFVYTPALGQQIDAAIAAPRTRMLLDQGLSAGTSKNVVTWLTQALGAAPQLEYDLPKTKARLAAALTALGFVGDAAATAVLDTMTVQNLPPQTFEQLLQSMPRYNESQVLANFAQYTRSPVIVAKPDVEAYLKRAEVKDALGTALAAAAVDKASVADVLRFFVDAHQKGMTLLEVRQHLGTLASQPQVRLQQQAQARGLQAPTLKADVDVLLKQLEPSLKAQQLVLSPSVKKFVEKAIAARDVTQAQQFVQTLAQNAVDVAAVEAKRLGVAAPVFDRDWAAIEAALKPQLQAAHVLYDPGLQKLVRAAVEGGVPVAVLQRAFQYLNGNTLSQALKSAGVYLVGVAIPDVVVDSAAIATALQASYAAYTNVFSGWQPFVDAALKAGLTPPQVTQYASYVVSQGQLGAARYFPQALQLPDVTADPGALSTYLQSRWAGQWTPAHDAFLRTHFAAASSGVAVQRLWSLRPHDVVVTVAGAAKQAVPAGL